MYNVWDFKIQKTSSTIFCINNQIQRLITFAFSTLHKILIKSFYNFYMVLKIRSMCKMNEMRNTFKILYKRRIRTNSITI